MKRFKPAPGFSLLEVVFAVAISAMLALVLFQALAQGNRILGKVVTLSGHERAITTLEYLWDRELSGIFMPRVDWANRQSEHTGDDTDAQKQPESSAKSEVKADEAKKKDDEKNEIPKPFFYEHDETGNLKTFTFITTNALAVYGHPQVHMTRVMYRLEPDPDKTGTFLLVHQQSEELDPKRFEIGTHNGVRAYQVLGGIKSLKFEFLIDKKEDKKEAKKPEKNETKPTDVKADQKKEGVIKKIREFETLIEWKESEKEDPKKNPKNTDGQKGAASTADKKTENKRPDIPVFIRITLVRIDSADRTHTYQYWYSPHYDMQPFCSTKVTDMAGRREVEDIFQERQHFLSDAAGVGT